ncbi:hypothetical protein [Parasphingorhabdus sp.]|uniref:hypothetical protein n=1 Tax=Parasphingorhabdus sp. TaxID=2709688 RepID=UPI003003A621
MPDFARFLVIKTGWCDSYTGDEPLGNFSYFADGMGAERFNMSPTPEGFKVYCVTPAPQAAIMDGWTIAHVAVDPAEKKMKLVGWYENAKFLGDAIPRSGELAGSASVYSILAENAYQIPPEERPIIDHKHKLGSTRLGWLRGKETKTDWSYVRQQLESAIGSFNADSFDQRNFQPTDSKRFLGDTTRPLNRDDDGVQVDDGGNPYGRSKYAESPEHKALKEWAVANAHFFEYAEGDKAIGISEFSLPSGDSVDAVQLTDEQITLVEVKSRRSGERDIERGIFQCVKYAAVYEAMQYRQAKQREVNAVLLTENPVSDRLTALAGRLGIELKQHRIEQ